MLALFGFSVNGSLQTNIQTDGNGDGFYDLSYLQRLYPLDENDGAVGAANFVSANCSTTTGACAADGSLPLLSVVCVASDRPMSKASLQERRIRILLRSRTFKDRALRPLL